MLDANDGIARAVGDANAPAASSGKLKLHRIRSRGLACFAIEREVARLHFQRAALGTGGLSTADRFPLCCVPLHIFLNLVLQSVLHIVLDLDLHFALAAYRARQRLIAALARVD